MGRKEKFVIFKYENAVKNFKMESLYQNQRKTHIKTKMAELITKVAQLCSLISENLTSWLLLRQL